MTARAWIPALLTVVLLTGCGDEKGTSAPTTDIGPVVQTARFAFTANGLEPAVLEVDAAPEITLQLVSEDGRPHGITLNVPQGRQRLFISPGATQTLTLTNLQKGRRYRVVPDGATEPVVLQVR